MLQQLLHTFPRLPAGFKPKGNDIPLLPHGSQELHLGLAEVVAAVGAQLVDLRKQ